MSPVVTTHLDRIIAEGTVPRLWDENNQLIPVAQHDKKPSNLITCADGFTVSVIAGPMTHCSPRPGWPSEWGSIGEDYSGPYHEVEVGFPSVRPEPWIKWREYCGDEDKPTDTVYSYVPVQLVRELIELHGGEASGKEDQA